MFRNRTLLTWKEPRTAYKEAVKSLTRKDYLKAYERMIWKWALGTFVVFSLLQLFLQGRIAFLDILFFVLLIVGFVTFLWLVSLFANRTDPQVWLREKDILQIWGDGVLSVRYRDIENCIVSRVDFNEKPIHVLEIRHGKGQQSFIEIAPDIAPQTVMGILREKKVPVTVSLLHPLR